MCKGVCLFTASLTKPVIKLSALCQSDRWEVVLVSYCSFHYVSLIIEVEDLLVYIGPFAFLFLCSVYLPIFLLSFNSSWFLKSSCVSYINFKKKGNNLNIHKSGGGLIKLFCIYTMEYCTALKIKVGYMCSYWEIS